MQCAVEIQDQLAVTNAEFPVDVRMDFRIGINLGDVIAEDDTIYGDGVNVAAKNPETCRARRRAISAAVVCLPAGYYVSYAFRGIWGLRAQFAMNWL